MKLAWWSLAALSFLVLVLALFPILRIPSHIHIDYNEGWNAYHARDAWKGNLYGNVFTPVIPSH